MISNNLVLSMYVPSKPFSCLDGTLTIPFEFVNDDYCDCQGKYIKILNQTEVIIFSRW